MIVVQPETVIKWHRRAFRLFWRWKSRGRRPSIRSEIRRLIREMAGSNPTWGAPRIHAELLKLDFEVSERTVSRYLARIRPKPARPGSQSWASFLRNQDRCHLSLAKDTPAHRPVERPAMGKVVALPRLGGLHHRYTRRAA